MVPLAVVAELAAGRTQGVDLPDPATLNWMILRSPSALRVPPLATGLGPGETEVLALVLELPDTVAVLDDALARRVAQAHGISFTGTLGLLIDAKRAGLIAAAGPLLDQLQALGFRLSTRTRRVVLRWAGELP